MIDSRRDFLKKAALLAGGVGGGPLPEAPARVRNEDTDYGREASWKTFPDRLQQARADCLGDRSMGGSGSYAPDPF